MTKAHKIMKADNIILTVI